MGRKANPPLTVSVAARRARGVYVFRWTDPVTGKWKQSDSPIRIGGPSEREERKTRTLADRAAADFQVALRAEHEAAVAAEAAARLRDAQAWPIQIDGFVSKIRAGGAVAEYVEQVVSQLRRFEREARVEQLDGNALELRPLTSPRQITEDVVVRFLNGLMRTLPVRKPKPERTSRRKYSTANRPPKPEPPPQVPQPASVETKNHYLTTLKAFCNYLADRKVLDGNPVRNLRRPSAEVDRRRERRALTPEEFARLIVAAQDGPVVETMSGSDRAMMYLVATWTGYRRKELASVTLRQFQLDEEQPVLRVKAPDSKHRKLDKIPLHARVVESFRQWAASKGIVSLDRPVFELTTAGGSLRDTAKMMQRDLAAAGLPYFDEEGLVADFHANRAAFITNLVRSGIPFFRVVELARHSDPRLTKRYDKSTTEQLADDVHRLPEPPQLDGKTWPPSPPTLRFGSG